MSIKATPKHSLPGKKSNKVIHTANNFGFMYSRKRISQYSFPNFTYIFPKSFMIFCHELLDPKRNYENPDFNLGSQGCHMKKINFTPRIWSLAPCINCKYFVTGPSKLLMTSFQLREQSSKPIKVTGKNYSPW